MSDEKPQTNPPLKARIDPQSERNGGSVAHTDPLPATSFSDKPKPADHDTAILPKDGAFARQLEHHAQTTPTSTEDSSPKEDTKPFASGEQREVILLIRGMVERLVVSEGKMVKVGRFEMGAKKNEEVDLTPYGALDRGVSRLHAQFHIENSRLYLTDLGSTNGTYISGKRLEPYQSTLVPKGAELLMGRLIIQVLFR